MNDVIDKMNHINQINQMIQINQLKQLNQMDQMDQIKISGVMGILYAVGVASLVYFSIISLLHEKVYQSIFYDSMVVVFTIAFYDLIAIMIVNYETILNVVVECYRAIQKVLTLKLFKYLLLRFFLMIILIISLSFIGFIYFYWTDLLELWFSYFPSTNIWQHEKVQGSLPPKEIKIRYVPSDEELDRTETLLTYIFCVGSFFFIESKVLVCVAYEIMYENA
jgi:hypothetical protein